MIPHIPVLRFGQPYESLDKAEVCDPASGEVRARMSLANSGLIRRDIRLRGRDAFESLQAMKVTELIDICRDAAERFLHGDVPWGEGDRLQSPEDFVRTLSATSGLPHNMCRGNMQKIHYVMANMDVILRGLTRGLDLQAIDEGFGEQGGTAVSFFPTTHLLGAVLPSNSPGVHSIWIPSIALKMPIVLKPGTDEPWTPWRIVQSLIAAGCPGEAFGFYPAGHDGAAEIMQLCGRSIIFGDQSTVAQYAEDPSVNAHGPGWSKVILGEDAADAWEEHLPVLVHSILANGGRSCINASCILTPRHGDAIADALARELAKVEPTPPADPDARLSAFARPAFAQYIDSAIDQALQQPGAEDVTARHRQGPRLTIVDGRTYLRPTLIRAVDPDHPLGNTEYMCPFASVVEMPVERMLPWMGPSLVVTAITRQRSLIDRLFASPQVSRLNIGPVSTCTVQWDQPHEGNLFEFLYQRRAIQYASAWS